MTTTQILCATAFWIFTLIMAYKVGYQEGGADEFEKLYEERATWDEFS